jgi:hypothetical protein
MELGLVWLHFGHMELGALGAGVPYFGHRIWGWCGFFLDIWSWGRFGAGC